MNLKIGIILASVREQRVGETVANWVLDEVNLVKEDNVSFEIIDLRNYKMPFVGITPTDEEAKTIDSWKSKMSEMDGYVLVTPEYNRMVPGALANAFQYLFPEVSDKALAFVGYGFLGAARAINNFRSALSILKLALVQKQINISFNTDFKNANTKDMEFTPGAWHKADLKIFTEQLTNWSKALKALREGKLN
ncbi:MAG: NAD(P)H-dependent oxidoreductase [Acholeplasmataceae bacterium]